MVGQQTLNLFIGVRIPVPQPFDSPPEAGRSWLGPWVLNESNAPNEVLRVEGLKYPHRAGFLLPEYLSLRLK